MLRFSAPFALLVLLSACGCSGEKISGPAPMAFPVGPAGGNTSSTVPAQGEVSLHLEPKEITRGTPVHVSATGFPLQDTTVEWLVNGDPVPGGGRYALDTGNLRRGDRIRARAKGPWGVAESEIVTVGNSPPEIRRVGFVPPEHKIARPLAVISPMFPLGKGRFVRQFPRPADPRRLHDTRFPTWP